MFETNDYVTTQIKVISCFDTLIEVSEGTYHVT